MRDGERQEALELRSSDLTSSQGSDTARRDVYLFGLHRIPGDTD